MTRQPHQIGLGVTCAVAFCDHRVFRLQQDLIVSIDEDGAKRMIAMIPGSLCYLNRRSEMSKIAVIQGEVLPVISTDEFRKSFEDFPILFGSVLPVRRAAADRQVESQQSANTLIALG